MPEALGPGWSGADTARLTIAPIFFVAGIIHILLPGSFASVMPPSIPYPGR